MNKLIHYSLRIESNVLRKIQYIAKIYFRSGNKQIVRILKIFINNFESQYSEITEEDMRKVGLIK